MESQSLHTVSLVDLFGSGEWNAFGGRCDPRTDLSNGPLCLAQASWGSHSRFCHEKGVKNLIWSNSPTEGSADIHRVETKPNYYTGWPRRCCLGTPSPLFEPNASITIFSRLTLLLNSQGSSPQNKKLKQPSDKARQISRDVKERIRLKGTVSYMDIKSSSFVQNQKNTSSI